MNNFTIAAQRIENIRQLLQSFYLSQQFSPFYERK